jgi:hypothetical protein
MIPVMIEAALRSLAVALAVGAGLHLLRVRNVLAQKIAWGLVLAASLFMPLMMRANWLPAAAQFHLTAPKWLLRPASEPAAPATRLRELRTESVELPGAPAAVEIVTPTAPPSSAASRYPFPAISYDEFAPPAHVPAVAQPSLLSRALGAASQIRSASFQMLAAIAYLAISTLLLFRVSYGVAIAARLWFTANPIEYPASLSTASAVPLRASDAVFSPVNIGSGVLLPADFAEWDSEKLRIVLAHERSHIRQGDFYLQMLAGVYAALFWFSPLGWWLKRRLSDLGEAISDRAGLQEAVSRASYAQVLLEFAAH